LHQLLNYLNRLGRSLLHRVTRSFCCHREDPSVTSSTERPLAPREVVINIPALAIAESEKANDHVIVQIEEVTSDSDSDEFEDSCNCPCTPQSQSAVIPSVQALPPRNPNKTFSFSWADLDDDAMDADLPPLDFDDAPSKSATPFPSLSLLVEQEEAFQSASQETKLDIIVEEEEEEAEAEEEEYDDRFLDLSVIRRIQTSQLRYQYRRMGAQRSDVFMWVMGRRQGRWIEGF